MIACTHFDLPFMVPRQPVSACAVSLTLPTYTGGGDTFDCYAPEAPEVTAVLTYGSGWSAPWVLDTNYWGWHGLQDTFETYAVGDNSGIWNAGSGFLGPWITNSTTPNSGVDTFETYAAGPVPLDNAVPTGRLNFWAFPPDVFAGVSDFNDSLDNDLLDKAFTDTNLIPANSAMDTQGLYLRLRFSGFVQLADFSVTAGVSYRVAFKTSGDPVSVDSVLRVMVAGWMYNPTWVAGPVDLALLEGMVSARDLDTTVATAHTSGLQANSIDFTAGSSGTRALYFYSQTGSVNIDDVVITVIAGGAVIQSQDFNALNPEGALGLADGTGWIGPWVRTMAPCTISPAPDPSLTFPLSVTIASPDGGTIYYTTDGSTPTTASAVYSAPITIATPLTVKAIAVTHLNQSDIAAVNYALPTLDSNLWAWWSADKNAGYEDSGTARYLNASTAFWTDQGPHAWRLRRYTGSPIGYLDGHYAASSLPSGKPTLYFDGSAAMVNNDAMATPAQPYSVYILFKVTSQDTNRGLFQMDASVNWRGLIYESVLPQGMRFYNNSSSISTTDTTVNTWRVLKLIGNGASTKIQLDNLTEVTGDPGGTGAAGNGLFLGLMNTIAAFKGEIAAVIISASANDATTQAIHKNWLAAYGGITI